MRILLDGDDRVAQRVAQRALARAGYDVEVVADGEQAWERLLADPDRILVTDWMMPNMDGIELIRCFRAGTFSSYVYAIIVTALDDPDRAVEGLEAGADDYLAKPYEPRELVARVGAGARIVGLERDLRESRRQLCDLMTLDPVTGLHNRRAVTVRAYEEAARAADSGRAMSIALLSIDGLDEIAAAHGRECADEVRRAASRVIHAELRPYDELGRWAGERSVEFLPGMRWGGDQLLLVLADMDPAQAATEVARLRSARARLRLPVESAGAFSTTLTFGLGGAAAGERPNVDAIIECAQAGLHAVRAERTAA